MNYDNAGLTPDDYGSCALELICTYLNSAESAGTVMSSSNKILADWLPKITCPLDYFLVAFKLRTQSYLQSSDDIAVADFTFRCHGPGLTGTYYTDLVGFGLNMGTWGSWSAECPPGSAICSLQTRVENCSTTGDCTAIDDAKFVCCDFCEHGFLQTFPSKSVQNDHQVAVYKCRRR